MTTKVITDNFKLHNARQFVESFSEPEGNLYYVYAGRHLPFPEDNNPPNVELNAFDISYGTWDNMIHGKLVSSSDVQHMIRRIDWTLDTVYTEYTHDNDLLDISDYYVASLESGSYHVFLCLGNNSGVASTVAPLFSQTSEIAESYYTSDGYQWKFMYSISGVNWTKFTTANFMPVSVNTLVQGATVAGAIDAISVVDAGKDYLSFADATFASISVSTDPLLHEISGDDLELSNDFYNNCAVYVDISGDKQLRTITDYFISGNKKFITIDSAFTSLPSIADTLAITPSVTIIGDGTGATARAVVDPNTNSISHYEVISRGTGYTFASTTTVGYTGSIVASTAVGRVIIGPINGHGYDPLTELGSHNVCVSTIISGNESGNIGATNEIREIGLLRDPLMRDVGLTIDHRNAAVDLVTDGEIIWGAISNAYGEISLVTSSADIQTIKVTNVFGKFDSTEDVYSGTTLALAKADYAGEVTPGDGLSRLATVTAATHNVINNSVFDQRHVYSVAKTGATDAVEDDKVVQDGGLATEVTAYIHENSSNTILYLTNQKGFVTSSDAGTGVDEHVNVVNDGTKEYKIIDYVEPQMIYNTGDILYKEYISPVTRTTANKEQIKLVIEF